MTERFWAIIDQARQGRPASVDAKALARVLNFLSDREVSAFGHIFMGEALRPQFLGIVGCRLHHRGMSDDGFHYFRSWIIGTGKSVFDVAMRNPDGIGPWIDDREVDNQSLEYVAVEIM